MANKRDSTELTVDEMTSYLKRTGLPTVVVEGRNDLMVYRYIEERFGDLGADFVRAGGRPALLKLFDRRASFTNGRVVFLADRDFWYFSGIPEPYEDEIIFTQGYSIENDVLQGAVIDALLTPKELPGFLALVKELCKWFAIAVTRFKAGEPTNCDITIHRILADGKLAEDHMRDFLQAGTPDVLAEGIFQDYSLALRGKTLLEALLRFLSKTDRESKFSAANVFELGTKLPNPAVEQLLGQLNAALV